MLDKVEFEDLQENNRILLRKANFALMIPIPSSHCSYVVFNFWANLSRVVLIKLFFKKKRLSTSNTCCVTSSTTKCVPSSIKSIYINLSSNLGHFMISVLFRTTMTVHFYKNISFRRKY